MEKLKTAALPNTKLAAALFYASRGWRVFPCLVRDKHPACKWKSEATIDAERLHAWWGENPNYNVGLACGAVSGIVVLDVDPDPGGNESLLALIVTHGHLPLTPESLTGGGGRHLIFAHPGISVSNSAGKLGPGLDIRGDGGYIIAPPSTHPNGRAYEWEISCKPSQTPLAPLPPWMLNLLLGTNGNASPQPAATVEGNIRKGARNQTLASLAGSMRRRGMGDEAIYAALAVENQKRCAPPLSEDEVRAIAKSVSRYTPADIPQARPIFSQIEARAPLDAYQGFVIFLDLLTHLEGRSIPTFISPIDIALGGLERQTFSVLAARPSMGKSTLAWQIARNVATNGLRVYVFSMEMSTANLWAKAACGAAGIRWRDVRAGIATPDQVTAVIDRATELMDRYGDKLLVDDGPNTSQTIWQGVEKYRPDLVIVDHLRLIADRSDNEVQRLGFISQALKEIAKEFNCHVMSLAQLNRETEGRDNKRPLLADLRDSGQIEENADLVLMMYRPDYYDPPLIAKPLSETELLVKKFRDDINHQRIQLTFDMRHQWFNGKDGDGRV